jgi:hypothetical protein
MKAEGALFVHLLINQASADVATRIRRSYGSTLFEVDATETGWESVPILLDAPGDYLVEIERRDKNAGGGQYQLEVREMRQSLESDHPHVDAARLATETRRVVGERKPGAQEAALRVSCFGE